MVNPRKMRFATLVPVKCLISKGCSDRVPGIMNEILIVTDCFKDWLNQFPA